MLSLPDCATAADCAAAVVIDTQVVLDWVLFDDPRVQPWAQAIAAQRVRWIYTADMRAEALRVVHYPALAKRFEPQQAAQKLVLAFARWGRCHAAGAAQRRLSCADADDQMFIDLALARRAAALLSRDRAVLRLARRALELELRITTPEQWLPPG
ncbi:MAG: putative toxin-antitoxin system toxin component, PIN family [Thiomonas sp.]